MHNYGGKHTNFDDLSWRICSFFGTTFDIEMMFGRTSLNWVMLDANTTELTRFASWGIWGMRILVDMNNGYVGVIKKRNTISPMHMLVSLKGDTLFHRQHLFWNRLWIYLYVEYTLSSANFCQEMMIASYNDEEGRDKAILRK